MYYILSSAWEQSGLIADKWWYSSLSLSFSPPSLSCLSSTHKGCPCVETVIDLFPIAFAMTLFSAPRLGKHWMLGRDGSEDIPKPPWAVYTNACRFERKDVSCRICGFCDGWSCELYHPHFFPVYSAFVSPLFKVKGAIAVGNSDLVCLSEAVFVDADCWYCVCWAGAEGWLMCIWKGHPRVRERRDWGTCRWGDHRVVSSQVRLIWNRKNSPKLQHVEKSEMADSTFPSASEGVKSLFSVCVCVCVCLSWLFFFHMATFFRKQPRNCAQFVNPSHWHTSLSLPVSHTHTHTHTLTRTAPCGFTANMFPINFHSAGWVLSCSKMYSWEPQIMADYPQPARPNQTGNLLSGLVMFSVSGDLSWRLQCADWGRVLLMWSIWDEIYRKHTVCLCSSCLVDCYVQCRCKVEVWTRISEGKSQKCKLVIDNFFFLSLKWSKC